VATSNGEVVSVLLGRAFVGELVGLKPIADNTHEVYLHGHLIGLLYEQDPAGMRPALIARHPRAFAPALPLDSKEAAW